VGGVSEALCVKRVLRRSVRRERRAAGRVSPSDGSFGRDKAVVKPRRTAWRIAVSFIVKLSVVGLRNF
jgi:hypothetical protein